MNRNLERYRRDALSSYMVGKLIGKEGQREFLHLLRESQDSGIEYHSLIMLHLDGMGPGKLGPELRKHKEQLMKLLKWLLYGDEELDKLVPDEVWEKATVKARKRLEKDLDNSWRLLYE